VCRPVVDRLPTAARLTGYQKDGQAPNLRRGSYLIHLENGPAVQSAHDPGVDRP
jgi:hypothetical protein